MARNSNFDNFYSLEIFLNSLILFDIYKNKYIFKVLYLILNRKFLNIVYLIKL